MKHIAFFATLLTAATAASASGLPTPKTYPAPATIDVTSDTNSNVHQLQIRGIPGLEGTGHDTKGPKDKDNYPLWPCYDTNKRKYDGTSWYQPTKGKEYTQICDFKIVTESSISVVDPDDASKPVYNRRCMKACDLAGDDCKGVWQPTPETCEMATGYHFSLAPEEGSVAWGYGDLAKRNALPANIFIADADTSNADTSDTLSGADQPTTYSRIGICDWGLGDEEPIDSDTGGEYVIKCGVAIDAGHYKIAKDDDGNELIRITDEECMQQCDRKAGCIGCYQASGGQCVISWGGFRGLQKMDRYATFLKRDFYKGGDP